MSYHARFLNNPPKEFVQNIKENLNWLITRLESKDDSYDDDLILANIALKYWETEHSTRPPNESALTHSAAEFITNQNKKRNINDSQEPKKRRRLKFTDQNKKRNNDPQDTNGPQKRKKRRR